jgi:hypothetical protein
MKETYWCLPDVYAVCMTNILTTEERHKCKNMGKQRTTRYIVSGSRFTHYSRIDCGWTECTSKVWKTWPPWLWIAAQVTYHMAIVSGARSRVRLEVGEESVEWYYLLVKPLEPQASSCCRKFLKVWDTRSLAA